MPRLCDAKGRYILDCSRVPLRLGGLTSADDGLFDYNGAAEDVVIDLSKKDAWTDVAIAHTWKAPETDGDIPFVGFYTGFAVGVSAAAMATVYAASPLVWSTTQNHTFMHVEDGVHDFKQELRAGFGPFPTPQVSAAVVDASHASDEQYVAGMAMRQAFRDARAYRPGGQQGVLIDHKRAKYQCVTADATALGTIWAADLYCTLLLWGFVAHRNDFGSAEEVADAVAEIMPDRVPVPRFQGRRIGG